MQYTTIEKLTDVIIEKNERDLARCEGKLSIQSKFYNLTPLFKM